MRNTMQKLRQVMPPPKRPLDAVGDWTWAESRLGTRLPNDYKRFIETWGSGEICDNISVLNPFAPYGPGGGNLIIGVRGRLRAYKNHPPPEELFPWGFFPSPGGLLPWGGSKDGDEFYWRTCGAPNRWDVVLHDRGAIESHLIEGRSFSEVLLAMLMKELKEFRINPYSFPPGPRFTPR